MFCHDLCRDISANKEGSDGKSPQPIRRGAQDRTAILRSERVTTHVGTLAPTRTQGGVEWKKAAANQKRNAGSQYDPALQRALIRI